MSVTPDRLAEIRHRLDSSSGYYSLRDGADVQFLLDALSTCQQERDTLQGQRDYLFDLPLCRLQLPDGSVPGCTEEALHAWHRVALDALRQVNVLKPGGMYAWKSRAEVAEARVVSLLQALKDEHFFREKAETACRVIEQDREQLIKQLQENRMTEPTKVPVPSIGRIVHYRLSADDAAQINRRRTTGHSIAERMKYGDDPQLKAWPAGAQAHIGNDAKKGDTVPMLIVKTWGDTPDSAVNGQAFLDGNDVLWVTSVSVGEGPRTFSWPTLR